MADNPLYGYEGDNFLRRKLGLGGTSAYSYGQRLFGGGRALDGIYGSGNQITPTQSAALRKPLIVKRAGLTLEIKRPRILARLRQMMSSR